MNTYIRTFLKFLLPVTSRSEPNRHLDSKLGTSRENGFGDFMIKIKKISHQLR